MDILFYYVGSAITTIAGILFAIAGIRIMMTFCCVLCGCGDGHDLERAGSSDNDLSDDTFTTPTNALVLSCGESEDH